MSFHFTIEKAIEQLAEDLEKKFTVLFKHGTMSIEYYAPEKVDLQTPHKQDELYIIASGSGTFFNNGERVQFKKGDVLFAAAGIEHRFENFSDDFSTWVIFYGAEGGEK